MKATARIKAAFSALVGKTLSPSAWLHDTSVDSGGAKLTSAFQQSVWVYSCVSLIGRTLASIPFRVWRGPERGGALVESGAVVDLLEQPHPQINRFDFWELLSAWLLLRGSAYVVGLDRIGQTVSISGPRPAKPARLMILPTDLVRPHVQAGELLGYRFMPGNDEPVRDRYLLPEEVIQIRLPSPFDFWNGQSPAFVASLAAQTDYAAAQFMKGLMSNNADTGVIVTTDQMPSDEQRQQILAGLKERKRAAGTADRPMLLWGGFKIERPQVAAADMEFLGNRKMSRQEICAVFGVPQELIGFTEDANRSVGDAMRASFIENTICPHAERFSAALRPLVKIFGPDLDCWLDTDAHPAMQAQRRARFQTAQPAQLMGVPLATLNDVFDLGLPDDLPGSTDVLRPFSVEVVGQVAAQPVAPPPAAEGENAFLRLAAALSNAGATRNAKPETRNSTHQCGAPDQHYAAAIAGAIRTLNSKLRAVFFEQRSRVLSKLSKKLSNQPGTRNSEPGTTPQRRAIDDLWDSAAEDAALLGRVERVLLSHLNFGGAQMMAELDQAGISFQLSPAGATRFLEKRRKEIKGINDTTFAAIKDTLSIGIDAGDSYEQLADRVREVFNDASDSRAETIAVTETNIAINTGRFEAMEQAGVQLKAWLASSLDNVRPAHAEAGRKYATGIPLDDTFIVGGEELDYPGDPTGSPGNIINCRCSVVAVMEDGQASYPRSAVGHARCTTRNSEPGTLNSAKPPLVWEAWIRAQTPQGASGGSGDTTRGASIELQRVSGVLQNPPGAFPTTTNPPVTA